MEVIGYTIIEVYADYICVVLVGDKDTIGKMCTELNKTNTDTGIKYISVRIDVPVSISSEKMQKSIKKNIEIGTSVETAQPYAYACGFKKNSYALMMLEETNDKVTLLYPKLSFNTNDDPEDIIIKWLKKK